MSDQIVVIKKDENGIEKWRYPGKILVQDAGSVLIEAFFSKGDMDYYGIVFARGDRFLERYFSNRWYNIYELHDKDDGALKGWYCNVTRPAVISDGLITFEDLALDLLVYPDGSQLVLDQDEFDVLDLDADEKKQALKALAELRKLFRDLDQVRVFTRPA